MSHPSPHQVIDQSCCHLSHITSSGRDHSCHHFWFSPITTSGHRSFVLSLQSHITSSSHHHSYCHFCCTLPHRDMGHWCGICHSSHIRTLFIRAVAYVAHYHIRTGIIRSVTSVTHHHTWTLIICAVLNHFTTSAIAHSCSPCRPSLHPDIYNSCCHLVTLSTSGHHCFNPVRFPHFGHVLFAHPSFFRAGPFFCTQYAFDNGGWVCLVLIARSRD